MAVSKLQESELDYNVIAKYFLDSNTASDYSKMEKVLTSTDNIFLFKEIGDNFIQSHLMFLKGYLTKSGLGTEYYDFEVNNARGFIFYNRDISKYWVEIFDKDGNFMNTLSTNADSRAVSIILSSMSISE